jgi:quercetin dioxygenase-like cupin family protein
MKILHYTAIPNEKVEMEGAEGVKIRWLISEKDDAKNFFMRMFEIQKGGHTPLHTHPHEHEVFILEGNGILVSETKEYEFKEGYVIFVEGGKEHQFKNTGNNPLRFLCLIPKTSY